MDQSSTMTYSSYRWVVLIIIFVSEVIGAFSQFILAVFGGYLINTYGLSTTELSSVIMAPMLTGVFVSIIAGVIADKKGVKASFIIAGAVGIVGTLIRIYADSYGMLFFCMLLQGFFPVFISSNAAKLIVSWFPEKELGIGMGVFMAGGGAGAALAQAVTAGFSSFHSACVFTLIATIIAYILLILLIKDRPANYVEIHPEVKGKVKLGGLWKLPHLWIIGITMVCFMAYNMSVNSFMPTALNIAGMDLPSAGLVTSIFAFGILAGTLSGSVVINKIGRGKFRMPCLIFGILCMVFLYLGWTIKDPVITSVFYFIGAYCLAAMVPVMMSAMVLIPGMKAEYMGAAGGFMNTARFVAAFVIPSYLFAGIAGSNFNLIFIMTAVSGLLMGVFAMFVPEVFYKGRKGKTV